MKSHTRKLLAEIVVLIVAPVITSFQPVAGSVGFGCIPLSPAKNSYT